ncbi:MAG: ATP-binding protein, partial [Pyrinomonadaceae bacterium]
AAVGIGSQISDAGQIEDVVWLAAEFDSKLEVPKELAEFWCDRLEAAALMCDLSNYRIWLVAPEGFSSEALEVIAKRNGVGSSRRQAEMLKGFLDAEIADPTEIDGDEYEITIPMGGESELVAAHTLEDIARKHGFGSSDINQIKTAVVEACINASEHSHSPDGQIRISFNVASDRISVTVANRGVRLADQMPNDKAESETRRGWGLKLIERLMDEVRLDQTDDGTSITMSKLLAA